MFIVAMVISFLLDGIISGFIQVNSIFLPLFSLLSLVLVYPYFKNKNKNFLIAAAIMGCMYDVVYTNSLFLNGMLFVLLAIVIDKLFSYLPINILNTYMVSAFVITVYRALIFLFLVLIQVVSFDMVRLSHSIASSVLANLFYVTIVYVILSILAKRYNIKKESKI